MSLRLPCTTRFVRLPERHSSVRSTPHHLPSSRTDVATRPFTTRLLLDDTTNPASMPSPCSHLRASGVQSTYAVEPAV